MFEAFKAGEIDLRTEDDPVRWVDGYRFAAVADGRVVKTELEVQLPSGMTALVFNTRRPPFQDQRVRRAFILHVRRGVDQPQPVQRPLQAHAELLRALVSLLARPAGRCARARPADAVPRAGEARGAGRHLQAAGHRRQRRQPRQPAGRPQAAHRGRLRARRAAVSSKGGTPLDVEFLAQTRSQERLLLSFARTLDAARRRAAGCARSTAPSTARGVKSFDFDMLQWTWTRLAVARQRADQPLEQQGRRHRGRLNLVGAKNPGRRRHDRRAAARRAGRRISSPPCAPSTAC